MKMRATSSLLLRDDQLLQVKTWMVKKIVPDPQRQGGQYWTLK